MENIHNVPSDIPREWMISNVELNCSNNQLTNLPESIGSLSNLQQLDCGNNQLINLPESIKSLSNLQILYCHNNQLTKLPESIKNSQTNTIDEFKTYIKMKKVIKEIKFINLKKTLCEQLIIDLDTASEILWFF